MKLPDDATPQPSTPPAGAIPEAQGVESRAARSHARTPRLHRVCDVLTEALIYGMVIFTPWAFGTTWLWAIWSMNVTAYVLGLLQLLKWLVRWRTDYRPERWGEATPPDADSPGQRRFALGRALPFAMAGLTVLVLAYCLIGALNARATFLLEEDRFEYHKFIPWLPHSYDGPRTWFAFWTYLGLAFFFWALRDWLLSKTRRERRHTSAKSAEADPGRAPRWPRRLRTLLWVLCLNGALLSLEAILQRLDGTNKLLWLVEPYWNKTAEAQFGPYAYRSNAAQYLNLVWPVCLGFWWMLRQSRRHSGTHTARTGGGPDLLLLPCAMLMAAGPIVSASRGGALIALGNGMTASALFILAGDRRGRWKRASLLLVVGAALGLGGYLGWPALQKRLASTINRYPSPVRIEAGEFSLRCAFQVPEANPEKAKIFAGLSDSRGMLSSPGEVLALLTTDGSLQIRLYGDDKTNVIQKIVPGFVTRHAGRAVDLIMVRTTNLAVFVDGQIIKSSERSTSNQLAWTNAVNSAFLWFGRRNSTSPYLDLTVWFASLYNRGLTAEEIAEITGKETPTHLGLLRPSAHFDLDRMSDSRARWLVSDLSGREDIYANARRIAQDFRWLGTGAGTFGSVYHLYRGQSDEVWAAYAHDDWLETRVTLGRVGFGLVVLLLLLAALPGLVGAGIEVPGLLPAVISLALAGCLIHARFDFPFQVYSVLFLFLLLCAVLSCLSRKS